jgi:hypothetical protein
MDVIVLGTIVMAMLFLVLLGWIHVDAKTGIEGVLFAPFFIILAVAVGLFWLWAMR